MEFFELKIPQPESSAFSKINNRPADIVHPFWIYGAPIALDLTITSSLEISTIKKAVEGSGCNARLAEDSKKSASDNFYNQSNVIVQGIAFESSSGICSASLSVLNTLPHRCEHVSFHRWYLLLQ